MCWEDQKIARKKYSQNTNYANIGDQTTLQLPANVYRCGVKILSDLIFSIIPATDQSWWACAVYKGTGAISENLIAMVNPYENPIINIEDYGYDLCGPLYFEFFGWANNFNWYIHEIFLNYKNELE